MPGLSGIVLSSISTLSHLLLASQALAGGRPRFSSSANIPPPLSSGTPLFVSLPLRSISKPITFTQIETLTLIPIPSLPILPSTILHKNRSFPWPSLHFFVSKSSAIEMEASPVAEDEAVEEAPPNNHADAGGANTIVLMDIQNVEETEAAAITDAERFRHRVDDLISTADELEQRVNEVEQFYANKMQVNNSKGNSASKEKDKDKEKLIANNCINNTVRSSGCKKEVVCTKRMQELMRQFGTILRQISQHKWAEPFMHPVDVKGLQLDDYYEVIKKPMDFSTIKNQMEAGIYKHVREIYADVRLVFANAMIYNNERHDIHVMAKTLLEKFEQKWLLLLPKVTEEETRQKEEAVQAQANMLIVQEAAMAKVARDTNNKLDELNSQLEELRELVIQQCRKMSAEEKRKLGVGLSSLSPEDLTKALAIISQNNPSFQATAEEVDLDMDAQSETTLWRLKLFVKEALELQAKNSASKGDGNLKHNRAIYDAFAKTAKRKKQKPFS